MTGGPIAFNDLQAQRRRLGPRLTEAIERVLAHGAFIMGPEVAVLEGRLADFCGARHAIGCANGTDALVLGLTALGAGPGDAVLVPAFTFAATAEAVAWTGATPVFVDVLAATFNMDGASLERGVAAARAAGLRPVGVITVDLFGQPADHDLLGDIAAGHGLWLMDDAAQAFGATYRGRGIGSIGRIATTSFFPAKPLGCYGDGGALFTGDDELAHIVRSLRVHGQADDKYDNVRVGMNSRLDTVQAAILMEKLAVFPAEIAARQRIAERYTAALAGRVGVPRVIDGASSVWAQYTVVVDGDRAGLAARLKAAGIPTAIYYPKPLHRQTAYRACPVAGGGLPVAERLAETVLSLPMHPDLDDATQDRIVAALGAALA